MRFRTTIIRKLLQLNEAVLFYPKLRKFYRNAISKSDVSIIDVGANRGQSIAFFLKLFPKAHIYSFEPNAKLSDFLVKKYAGNPNITIDNSGVSNKIGRSQFNENVLDETSTFEKLNADSAYLQKKAAILGVDAKDLIVDCYDVEVTTLSEFLRINPNGFFDILKIDVEGHEFECLEGLFFENVNIPIRFIQIESHNDDMYVSGGRSKQIEALLNANDFEQIRAIKHGFGDFEEIIYENKKL